MRTPLKKILCFFLCVGLLAAFSSCGEVTRYETDTDQLAMPETGETIAIVHTSLGDISFRLFPKDAPTATENFISLAKDGKYDGVSIFRSEANYLIQSGDYENNDGSGGKSYRGGTFGVEVSNRLHNIRGALGMARSDAYDSCGSQFYVVTRGYASVTYTETLKDTDPDLAKKYEDNGGIPELDEKYTVFGQAFDGFDALDAINAVPVDDNNCPLEPVYIFSIEITTYQP